MQSVATKLAAIGSKFLNVYSIQLHPVGVTVGVGVFDDVFVGVGVFDEVAVGVMLGVTLTVGLFEGVGVKNTSLQTPTLFTMIFEQSDVGATQAQRFTEEFGLKLSSLK